MRHFFPRPACIALLATLVAIAAVPVTELRAEQRVGLLLGRNGGDLVFETGSKQRDLIGFAGGSRLTYPRDFNYAGLGYFYGGDGVELRARVQTTGWQINPGTSTNEDFTLNQRSSIRRNGFDTGNWSFRDSAYVIGGSRNFAVAQGRTSLIDHQMEALLRFYPSAYNNASDQNAGFFLETGLRYSYNKQYVYDAVQWISTRSFFFYGPIGRGNSLSNVIWEIPVGAGYRWEQDRWAFDASFMIISGWSYGRDFHFQRNITFEIERASGDGFLYRIGPEYRWNDDYLLRMSLYGHRYYSRGLLRPRGGLGQEALFIAFSGKQTVWLSTKQAGVEFSLERRL